jgi:hypothetical protein
MKRLVMCFAFLLVMLWPAQALADAQGVLPPGSVTLVSPNGNVSNPWVYFNASITGQTLPGDPANLTVSYARFWIDVPQSQRDNPQPFATCPASPSTCQYMGTDRTATPAAPGSVVYDTSSKYQGPRGRHVATVQAWRSTNGDANPVFMGQDSNDFCLNGCK